MSKTGLLAALAITCLAAQHAVSEDLDAEDTQAIRAVFLKTDPAFGWFHVVAKQPVDATYSVMVVQAARGSTSPIGPVETAVLAVSGRENQVRLVIDRLSNAGTPSVEVIGTNSVYLHFYGDYFMYQGSIKYLYNLAGQPPVVKIPYKMIALTASWRISSDLFYAASSGDKHETIQIEPHRNSNPSFQILDDDPGKPPGEDHIWGPSGEVVTLSNTPLGQSHRPSGFVVRSGASQKFYPVPVPTMAQYREMVPEKQTPGEIENDIGPFVQDHGRIWFANTFYDSEGVSGVGAIGEFDIASRQFEMHYLPEIAPWSGSAILLIGDDLWVGLKRRPEGAEYGAGLLRYNVRTGSVTKWPLTDLVNTISSVGDDFYFGTSNGLYIFRGGEFTQFRFEPDATGKVTMIERAVHLSETAR